MQTAFFQNRVDAGEKLAKELLRLKQNQTSLQDAIVVAIPRGGVIVGDVIATKLGVKLDIVVSRKIGAPDNSEVAMGAVMPDGSYFLNEEIVNALNVSREYIEEEVREQLKEIYRRLLSYRGSRYYDKEFDGNVVVLVDDGVATGATLIASAQWIKTNRNCKKLIVAAPVAPRDTFNILKNSADEIIVLYTPDPFISIGRFYEDFEQVSDEQVKEIMRKYEYRT
jgi:putative phosphoribosyl transferase